MAFPTTSVLTNFTGSDENPLSEGGNWTGPFLVGRGQWQRLSNVARATSGATCQSHWTPATYTQTEVFATIAQKGTANGQWMDLVARIRNSNSANASAYQLEITVAAGTDTWDLYRVINASGTLINSFTSTEVATGDSVGMVVSGTGATVTIEAWHKPSAGSWTMIGSFGDTDANRIVTAGEIGIETSNNSGWRLDDFGGGEIVVPVTGIEYKRFTGPAQLTGSAATLYTCPSGRRARVLNIHASNPSASEVDLNLSIGADAAATRVYDDFPIAADGVEFNYDPYDLAAGDTIQGFASTAGTVVLSITGYEVPE